MIPCAYAINLVLKALEGNDKYQVMRSIITKEAGVRSIYSILLYPCGNMSFLMVLFNRQNPRSSFNKMTSKFVS